MDKNPKILIGIIVVLLLGVGILGFLFFSQKQQTDQLIGQMELDKEQLEKEYSDLMIEFDTYQQDLTIQNDSLTGLLTQEQKRVQDLLEELRITKATNKARIAELKKELETVRTVMMDYVRQIDSLSAQNEQLKLENKHITRRYQEASEYANDLQKKNENLSMVVERASMLDVSDMYITRLNKRGKKTSLASQVAKYKFDYKLSKNTVAPRGMKKLYVRITASDGELMKDKETKTGTFLYEGQDVPYTLMKQFEYTGEAMSDVFYWTPEDKLPKDDYNIDFFVDENLIGTFSYSVVK